MSNLKSKLAAAHKILNLVEIMRKLGLHRWYWMRTNTK